MCTCYSKGPFFKRVAVKETGSHLISMVYYLMSTLQQENSHLVRRRPSKGKVMLSQHNYPFEKKRQKHGLSFWKICLHSGSTELPCSTFPQLCKFRKWLLNMFQKTLSRWKFKTKRDTEDTCSAPWTVGTPTGRRGLATGAESSEVSGPPKTYGIHSSVFQLRAIPGHWLAFSFVLAQGANLYQRDVQFPSTKICLSGDSTIKPWGFCENRNDFATDTEQPIQELATGPGMKLLKLKPNVQFWTAELFQGPRRISQL